MRLICPNCAAQYEIDAAVLPEKGRDVECSRCGQIWFQPRPQPEEDANFDAGARPALNRSLSDPVLSVLREEAARELRAREEDRARARIEKARFEAESFSRTPVPPAPVPPDPVAPDAARPEPLPADDRPRPKAAPAESHATETALIEAALIDWPATTITDERFHDAPFPPAETRTVDEWAVATPDLDTPEDRPASAPARADRRGDQSGDKLLLPPDTPAEDEPVATILFDEAVTEAGPALTSPAPSGDAQPGDERQDRAKAFSGLPDHADSKAAPAVTEDPQPNAPLLPVSVDSASEDAGSATRSGYARGFGLSIGLAAALAGFYLIAPSLSGPGALGGFAAEYRGTADQGRIWLGHKLGFLTGGD
ncbi:zinc-ribbon domain-containing protein [Paracoccus sp. DMF-8]|uniref:zinc-ribbon domain-containing protein n=1 Tax=Paracoccus sp. DMF-8 TaxID=3019445 RepID=UPI0023E4320C|nr:zinc-ribbon domain-containing protein [Paracoccus sp. DMF-8]MDF3607666.1 zinc-ribbon domain-containing protein [Paracoccus sp. DMF-8]